MYEFIQMFASNRFLVFIVALLIFAVFWLYRYTMIKRIFTAQALKRNGTIKRMIKGHMLSFTYDAHYYILVHYPGSRYKTPSTHVETRITTATDHCIEISSESLISEIGKKLGSKDIEVGYRDFDDQFIIKSDNEYFATSLLTYSVQDKLLKLRRLKPKITIKNNTLIVNVPRVLKKEEDYDLLIETAFTLVNRLQNR